jgi:hypothetical protein
MSRITDRTGHLIIIMIIIIITTTNELMNELIRGLSLLYVIPVLSVICGSAVITDINLKLEPYS